VGTIYLVYYLFAFLDNVLGTYLELLLGRPLPGLGLFASIVSIFVTGVLVSNVIGERLFRFGEALLHKMPILPKVYFGIKQIVDAFSLQGKHAFNRVVLIEYPRKGIYPVGFLTGECRGEVQTKTEARLLNVFVPTTPNPTSGMLILVPESEITHLDMTVEEGLKLIVSAGVVVPDQVQE
jgi:uncharacterized membrane protein